jgi:methionyl-tRNA synthetase
LDGVHGDTVGNYRFDLALMLVWDKMRELDTTIQTMRPFELVKTDPEAGRVLIARLVEVLGDIANHLVPFLPQTASAIIACIENNKMPTQPLFPRKD